MKNQYQRLSEKVKGDIISKAIKIANEEQAEYMNTFKEYYDKKFKKTENEKRLMFLEYVVNHEVEVILRKRKDKERDDLITSDCSDLFEELWKKTCKLFEKTVDKKFEEDVIFSGERTGGKNFKIYLELMLRALNGEVVSFRSTKGNVVMMSDKKYKELLKLKTNFK